MTLAFEKLLLGRVLADRYEIQEAIGSGGMSLVFRGLDRTLGRPVAVKVIVFSSAVDSEREEPRRRFRREAAAAARIPHHPNVVQIYDYGTDPELDLDFIVMELLVGRNLKEALLAGPMPPEAAARILRHAARGLSAGHRVGIVHRDVKPGNLFLSGDAGVEAVRVLDFGIAKPLETDPQDELTRTGQLAYSPAYASPEQLRGGRAATPASDVYQLGLIGYEMLAGERPFTDAERARIRSGEWLEAPSRGRWETVRPEVRAVIERALRIDPDDRFADAAEFSAALDDALDLPDHTVLTVVAPPVEDRVRVLPQHPADATATVQDAEAPVIRLPDSVLRASEPPPPRPPMPRWRTAQWAVPVAVLALLALLIARTASHRRTGAVDDSAVPAAAAGVPAAGATPSPAQPLTGDAAEAAQVVTDLNRAWVDGNLRRHVGFYASRVDYYNSKRLPRSGVRRDRTRDMKRYPKRELDLQIAKVEPMEDGRMRVDANKRWHYWGPEAGERSGSGVQEYILKRDEDDGKWYVVSEQMLSQTEQRTPASGA